MRSEGTNGFPKPLLNERAKVIAIKRRAGNEIELRIIRLPAPTKVVLLHFHAGGLFDQTYLNADGELMFE